MNVKIRFWFLIIGLAAAHAVSAKYSISAQGAFLHFLGETKLKHFGGGLKGEYEVNSWAGVSGAFNLFSKSDYTGIVEAEDRATGTSLIDIPVPSSISFMQVAVGIRAYFVGEIEPDLRGGFGVYGLGEVGLLVGTSESEVIVGEEFAAYNVPVQGTVKGTFMNYTASVGLGAEKQIGRPLIYLEAKFNAKLDEANSFSVSTRVPFGFSYFLGLRLPLFVTGE